MLTWRRVVFGVGMGVCLLAAGCSRQAEPVPAVAAAPLEVQEIVVRAAGDDPAGAHRAPVAAAPLQLQVRSRGGQPGEVISARLIYLADSSRAHTQAVALPGGQQPWTLRFPADAVADAGRYLLELTVEGRLMYSQEVDVAPVAQPGA